MPPLTPLLVATSYLLSLTTAATEATKYPNSIKLSYSILGSSSQPAPLAEILYDPTTLKTQLASWTPPPVDTIPPSSEPTSSKLVRILLPDGTSSSVTSLSALAPSLSQDINLWLSSNPHSLTPNQAIISASISSISPPPLTDEEKRQKRKTERALARGTTLSSKPTPTTSRKPKPSSSKSKSKKPDPAPRIIDPVIRAVLRSTTTPGATPQLLTRAPPRVDEQGREVPAAGEQEQKSFFQKYWWVFLIGTVLMMGGGGGDK